MAEDRLVPVGGFDQRQGKFDPDEFSAFQGPGGEETGLALAGSDVDEAIECDLRLYGLIQNDLQVSAGDRLIIGCVFQIVLDGALQYFLTDDAFQAQAVHFLKKIIFNSRAISGAIVENGQIEDVQASVPYHRQALR